MAPVPATRWNASRDGVNSSRRAAAAAAGAAAAAAAAAAADGDFEAFAVLGGAVPTAERARPSSAGGFRGHARPASAGGVRPSEVDSHRTGLGGVVGSAVGVPRPPLRNGRGGGGGLPDAVSARDGVARGGQAGRRSPAGRGGGHSVRPRPSVPWRDVADGGGLDDESLWLASALAAGCSSPPHREYAVAADGGGGPSAISPALSPSAATPTLAANSARATPMAAEMAPDWDRQSSTADELRHMRQLALLEVERLTALRGGTKAGVDPPAMAAAMGDLGGSTQSLQHGRVGEAPFQGMQEDILADARSNASLSDDPGDRVAAAHAGASASRPLGASYGAYSDGFGASAGSCSGRTAGEGSGGIAGHPRRRPKKDPFADCLAELRALGALEDDADGGAGGFARGRPGSAGSRRSPIGRGGRGRSPVSTALVPPLPLAHGAPPREEFPPLDGNFGYGDAASHLGLSSDSESWWRGPAFPSTVAPRTTPPASAMPSAQLRAPPSASVAQESLRSHSPALRNRGAREAAMHAEPSLPSASPSAASGAPLAEVVHDVAREAHASVEDHPDLASSRPASDAPIVAAADGRSFVAADALLARAGDASLPALPLAASGATTAVDEDQHLHLPPSPRAASGATMIVEEDPRVQGFIRGDVCAVGFEGDHLAASPAAQRMVGHASDAEHGPVPKSPSAASRATTVFEEDPMLSSQAGFARDDLAREQHAIGMMQAIASASVEGKLPGIMVPEAPLPSEAEFAPLAPDDRAEHVLASASPHVEEDTVHDGHIQRMMHAIASASADGRLLEAQEGQATPSAHGGLASGQDLRELDAPEMEDLHAGAFPTPGPRVAFAQAPAEEILVQCTEESSMLPDEHAAVAGEEERADIDALLKSEAEADGANSELLREMHWQKLNAIFNRLVLDGCREVSTLSLLDEIRSDIGLNDAGILDLVVVSSSAHDRRTTLRQALEHVEAQFESVVTWSRFRELVAEAPWRRRPKIQELVSEKENARRQMMVGRDPNPKRGSRAISSALDPAVLSELATRWAVEELGIDEGILSRIHARFANQLALQRGGSRSSLVRRGDLVKSIRDCEALAAELTLRPLCEGRARSSLRQLTWSEVLLDIERHESPFLSWIDVLEVIRWNVDRCLGLVSDDCVGPSGHSWERRGLPGPMLANGSALNKLQRERAYAAEPGVAARSPAPPTLPAIDAPALAALNGRGLIAAAVPRAVEKNPTVDTAEAQEERSPHAAASFAQPARHQLLPDVGSDAFDSRPMPTSMHGGVADVLEAMARATGDTCEHFGDFREAQAFGGGNRFAPAAPVATLAAPDGAPAYEDDLDGNVGCVAKVLNRIPRGAPGRGRQTGASAHPLLSGSEGEDEEEEAERRRAAYAEERWTPPGERRQMRPRSGTPERVYPASHGRGGYHGSEDAWAALPAGAASPWAKQHQQQQSQRSTSVHLRVRAAYEDWRQGAVGGDAESIEAEVARLLGVPVGSVRLKRATP
eukprot:TRINITY_DN21357_c0_g3_i1.p1 TRINITY_DN21357_c0_g3~~TRINITY_DN21357_c0_g3_i1.p1  ORF type:complete len:1495 (+),score=284.95 TRINITY_DN21357_c0_g3_i1:148-4632(+)